MTEALRIQDDAIKTYRYLRIAIVGMVAALLLGIGFERLQAGQLLGAISSYYYTIVNPLFVGALIMIGVSLVAIRGSGPIEETLLNLAGLLAPVVALVPTAPPDPSVGYSPERFIIVIEDRVEVGQGEPARGVQRLAAEMINTSVLAALLAAGAAVALGFLLPSLARRLPTQYRRFLTGEPISAATWWGFITAFVLIVGLFVLDQLAGQQATHTIAAGGLFVFLFVVATSNAMQPVTDRYGFTAAVWASVGGTGAGLGVGLVIMSLVRLGGGESHWWLWLVGGLVVAVVIAAVPQLRTGAKRYFGVLGNPFKSFPVWYVAVALTMLLAVPATLLWPGDWQHRIFVLELAELLPFALFWLVQTVEHWDSGIRGHPTRKALA